MATRRRYLWMSFIVILVIASSLVVIGLSPTHDSPSQTYNAELEYLKTIHSYNSPFNTIPFRLNKI